MRMLQSLFLYLVIVITSTFGLPNPQSLRSSSESPGREIDLHFQISENILIDATFQHDI